MSLTKSRETNEENMPSPMQESLMQAHNGTSAIFTNHSIKPEPDRCFETNELLNRTCFETRQLIKQEPNIGEDQLIMQEPTQSSNPNLPLDVDVQSQSNGEEIYFVDTQSDEDMLDQAQPPQLSLAINADLFNCHPENNPSATNQQFNNDNAPYLPLAVDRYQEPHSPIINQEHLTESELSQTYDDIDIEYPEPNYPIIVKEENTLDNDIEYGNENFSPNYITDVNVNTEQMLLNSYPIKSEIPDIQETSYCVEETLLESSSTFSTARTMQEEILKLNPVVVLDTLSPEYINKLTTPTISPDSASSYVPETPESQIMSPEQISPIFRSKPTATKSPVFKTRMTRSTRSDCDSKNHSDENKAKQQTRKAGNSLTSGPEPSVSTRSLRTRTNNSTTNDSKKRSLSSSDDNKTESTAKKPKTKGKKTKRLKFQSSKTTPGLKPRASKLEQDVKPLVDKPVHVSKSKTEQDCKFQPTKTEPEIKPQEAQQIAKLKNDLLIELDHKAIVKLKEQRLRTMKSYFPSLRDILLQDILFANDWIIQPAVEHIKKKLEDQPWSFPRQDLVRTELEQYDIKYKNTREVEEKLPQNISGISPVIHNTPALGVGNIRLYQPVVYPKVNTPIQPVANSTPQHGVENVEQESFPKSMLRNVRIKDSPVSSENSTQSSDPVRPLQIKKEKEDIIISNSSLSSQTTMSSSQYFTDSVKKRKQETCSSSLTPYSSSQSGSSMIIKETSSTSKTFSSSSQIFSEKSINVKEMKSEPTLKKEETSVSDDECEFIGMRAKRVTKGIVIISDEEDDVIETPKLKYDPSSNMVNTPKLNLDSSSDSFVNFRRSKHSGARLNSDSDEDHLPDFEEVNASPRTTSRPIDVVDLSDDDDYHSDAGGNTAIDSEDDDIEDVVSPSKQFTLTFLQTATFPELLQIPGCTRKKAGFIQDLRPFDTWTQLREKLEFANLSDLLSGADEFARLRKGVINLMERCERISEEMEGKVSLLMEGQCVGEDDYILQQPPTLTQTLKLTDYQMLGLNWLMLMHRQQLSGILADEMGLGKTIQTIAFLTRLLEEGVEGPHLIVCPSSTIENWLRELAAWSPTLQVIKYYGSQEDRRDLRYGILNDEMEDYHVIVTTYSMLTSTADDRVLFKRIKFRYVVYDEAHMLKNMSSQRYRHLIRIGSERRLLLTGTPLQNNLLELMSLLIFVMPKMFQGKTENIKRMFKVTAGDNGDTSQYEKDRIAHAKKIMKPFVLRRLKTEVLKELPAKHEHVIRVTLTSLQREQYDNLVFSFSKQVREDDDKLKLSGMTMLTDLRKQAMHPLLRRNYYNENRLGIMRDQLMKEPVHYDADPECVLEDLQDMHNFPSDYSLHTLCKTYKTISSFRLNEDMICESGKFRQFDILLPEMKQRGDRVLIFSQYTSMMNIMEEYMNIKQYKFLRLDGSTPVPERQKLIDDFSGDPSIFVFLLSTHAGGQGINLTAANVVIIHDIDINPYNDRQAEDRCHRVGQTREVNVYRLICENTVEETWNAKAQQKLKLEKHVTTNNSTIEDEEQVDMASLLKQALTL